jgi:acetyl esterase/lipase
LHSANLGVGSAIFSAAWGMASALGHLPGVVAIAGASLGGGLVVWQAVKARIEQARQDREHDTNPGG